MKFHVNKTNYTLVKEPLEKLTNIKTTLRRKNSNNKKSETRLGTRTQNFILKNNFSMQRREQKQTNH